MARITEKVKIYIHQGIKTGRHEYYMSDMTDYCGGWLKLVGTVDAVIEYDEADLVDPHATQLKRAERELKAHRAESAAKERQLLDKLESLRALPHLESRHD